MASTLDELQASLMSAVDVSNTAEPIKVALRASITRVTTDPRVQMRAHMARSTLVGLLDALVKCDLQLQELLGELDRSACGICRVIVGVWARENGASTAV